MNRNVTKLQFYNELLMWNNVIWNCAIAHADLVCFSTDFWYCFSKTKFTSCSFNATVNLFFPFSISIQKMSEKWCVLLNYTDSCSDHTASYYVIWSILVNQNGWMGLATWRLLCCLYDTNLGGKFEIELRMMVLLSWLLFLIYWRNVLRKTSY